MLLFLRQKGAIMDDLTEIDPSTKVLESSRKQTFGNAAVSEKMAFFHVIHTAELRTDFGESENKMTVTFVIINTEGWFTT